jgi:hypothetical protein
MALDSDRIISSKWLVDLARIYKFTKDTSNGMELRFSNGTYAQYMMQAEDRANALAAMRKSLLNNFGVDVVIEEISYDELVVQHETKAPREEASDIDKTILECTLNKYSKRRPEKVTHSII